MGCATGEVTINVTGELGCVMVQSGSAGLLMFGRTEAPAMPAHGWRALYRPQFHPWIRG
jgi:hypothetical protein